MVSSNEIIDRIKSSISNTKKLETIQLHEPYFKGSNAYKYLKECIDTGWVSSSGKWVTEFESLISNFTGSKYAIAVSNGTVALRLSLFLAGVRANDEVIIPPLTFVATANSISHLGAVPHFIDIEPETLGICPNALDRHLSEFAEKKGSKVFNKISKRKIAAVVPVHVFGLPAKIQEIKQVCLKWNLPLIEDAAEALGSKIKVHNKYTHCGCLGDIGTLSFNGNKIITCGGGGMIVTDDEKIAVKAKHLSTQAKADSFEYYHDEIGYNYRLTNVSAAIGLAQMEQLDKFIKTKHKIKDFYVNSLNNVCDIIFQNVDNKVFSNWWLFTIRTKKQKSLLESLNKNKLQSRPFWIPMNNLPMFKENIYITEKNISKLIYESALSIPCSTNIKPEELSRVVDCIKKEF